jgi:hemerythrin
MVGCRPMAGFAECPVGGVVAVDANNGTATGGAPADAGDANHGGDGAEGGADCNALAWSAALSVGVPQIDWEHRQLLELFAVLCDPSHRDNHAFRRGCLEDLIAHVCNHFDHEETLMRQVDYPELEHHRNAHLNLLDQFNRFLVLYTEFPQEVREEDLPSFVGAWLLDHIRGDDKTLGDFLQERARAQRILPGGLVPGGLVPGGLVPGGLASAPEPDA